jgi:hypothetical protein
MLLETRYNTACLGSTTDNILIMATEEPASQISKVSQILLNSNRIDLVYPIILLPNISDFPVLTGNAREDGDYYCEDL